MKKNKLINKHQIEHGYPKHYSHKTLSFPYVLSKKFSQYANRNLTFTFSHRYAPLNKYSWGVLNMLSPRRHSLSGTFFLFFEIWLNLFLRT